jgi:hypothetical protein
VAASRLSELPKTAVSQAIESGLKFLYASQLPSGEFQCFWSTHPTMETDCQLDSSPFPTALIAYSLKFTRRAKAQEIVRKACEFLLAEIKPGGLWKYWTPKHPYFKNIPCDADDTACASVILAENKIDFPDNRKILLSNRSRKGLFYTWVVPRLRGPWHWDFWRAVSRINPVRLLVFFRMHAAADPRDIDGVVNANVLYYLGESCETKPVIQYLIEIIQERTENTCDKWHLNPFNLYYSLSRNYFAGMESFAAVRETIVERIIESANGDGSIGSNVLDTALAVCTLLNFGISSPVLNSGIESILEKQSANGAWQRYAFYYGGPQYGGPDQYFGWGCEELTSGFCLEALLRWEHRLAGSSHA